MKKIATGVTLTAALGLSLFAAAPATALDRNGNYQNCAEVYAAGESHIGPDHPKYDAGLDSKNDEDLIGCENPDGADYSNAEERSGSEDSASSTTAGLPEHVTLPDAVDNQFAYPDCKDAWDAGLYNIEESSEYYHVDLDADLDGVGCEYNVQYGVAVEGREDEAAEEIAAIKASAKEEGVVEEQQVSQVPAGAVDAGVAPDSDPAAALTVGALGLAAVAGAGVAARRRARA